MTHLSPLSKAWIKEMSLDKSGDYTFHDYPKTSGVFHGYSYSYVRNGETVDLFGSMTERGGYTVFNFDCNRNLLIVEKDLEGVVMEEPYEAVDIVHLRGGFDEVFDRYFQLMEIPKPRVQHKCGYTTWYNYYPHINEKIVTDDLEALAKVPEQIDIFQIDDGYQTAVGDWLSTDPEKFPNGMKAVADQIHSKGMLAGLWLAPFGCEYHSTIAEKHPEWLIKNEKGKPVVAGLNWGGFYAIDFNHPEAAQYIRNCFDVILNEWGYDMVKLDFLYAACILPQYNKSRGQLMCEAMDFIRDCVGDKLILGCGVPLAPCYGKVDFCRIGADVCLDWKPTLHGYLTHREDATTKNAVNNTIYSTVKLFPYRQRCTAVLTWTGIFFPLQTSHRSKTSLCEPKYHSHSVFRRRFCQLVSATCTTNALYKARSRKNGYYLFKILVADVLSFSDRFDRHISALLM